MEDSALSGISQERLAEKLNRKQKELEILAEVFSRIRSTVDLDCILHHILAQLDTYFGFKYSMILLTGRGNFLKVVASHGYPERSVGAKVEIGKGIIGIAAKRKKIIRIGNITHNLQYLVAGEVMESTENEIIIKLQGLQNPQSQVAIPLLIQDELIGVLSVESDQMNVFKVEDDQIINLISNQAAIAIQNARLFEEQRQRLSEIEDINNKLSELTQTQQRTLDLFVRYVPEPVVRKALRERPDTLFEGEQKEIAILFCDIRDFTPVSEKLNPSQVVTLLNLFYTHMNAVIKKHNGCINQFVGDEIFVSFGAPIPVANLEERAVRCAIGMLDALKEINSALQDQLGVTILVGIGVHFGPVVTGNLGCEDKISYSITGDTVNTAKRIETLTREKPNSILISECLYLRVKELIKVNPWEPVSVKGKNEKMLVYEVLGCA
jgi:adenylate cyclase